MLPTVVLIPGLLSDRTVFEQVIRGLGTRGFVVADCTQQSSITGMAQDALASTSGPLAVVAHSMGARVAMEMARRSNRVTSLVMANTGVHPRRDAEWAARGARVRMAYERGMAALADDWLPMMVHRDDALATLRTMVMSMTPEIHERQIQALLTRPDASAYLDALRLPVLLVAADRDRWSPVDQHEEMHRRLADSKLRIVEGAGHYSPVERPDVFAEIVVEWLSSPVGTTP